MKDKILNVIHWILFIVMIYATFLAIKHERDIYKILLKTQFIKEQYNSEYCDEK